MMNSGWRIAAIMAAAGVLVAGGCCRHQKAKGDHYGLATVGATQSGGPITKFSYDTKTANADPALRLQIEKQNQAYSIVFLGTTANADTSLADFQLTDGSAYVSGTYPSHAWGWPVIITNHVRLGVEGTSVLAQTRVDGNASRERVFLLDTKGRHKMYLSAHRVANPPLIQESRAGYYDIVADASGNVTYTFTAWADASEEIKEWVQKKVTRACAVGAPQPQH